VDSALLRELARWWAEINDTQFEGAMRPPSLLLDEGTRRLGCWERGTRTLHLSAKMVESRPWQVVIEVLRHEMAHQYVDEVLKIRDETAHGPAFRAVCAERSIDGRATAKPEERPEISGIMRKVEGLLSLAESDNEHEAKSAMSQAHRLLRKHNIRLADAPSPDAYSFQQVGQVRGRTSGHEKILAGILGQHFFVQPIWVVAYDRAREVRGRVLELCGRPENLDIAAHVHGFMLETCERLWRVHKKVHGITSNRERRRYLQGVMIGFNERLKGEAEVCEERGLVWLGDAALHGWVGNRYPHIRSGRRTRMRMTDAWQAGRAAGQQVVWRRPVEKKGRGIRGLLGL
jgi:hypothetical protein